MRILLLVLLSLFGNQLIAQVKSFKLDNGLQILVKEDHRSPVVVSMIWYHVGSADEPDGITGISHALEHIMFKGTKKNPAGVFSKKIAAVGGHENALTSTDYTAYYEETAAMHLPLSLELEADRMRGLLFDKNEFNKEIAVVREERRLRTDDKPNALLLERFLAAAHLSEPYHHPTIGWMSDLKQLRINDVKKWYNDHYAPNNATLVVVGDVEAKKVYALAKQYFGPIKQRRLAPSVMKAEPPQLGAKRVEVHSQTQVPMLILGYATPSLNTLTKNQESDAYALELIAGILGAGDSSRLSKNLVHGHQIASNANVYYDLYSRFPTEFMIYGVPSATHSITLLKKKILAEIQRLHTELVSPKELDRVKNQLIAQKVFENDSLYDQAMEIGLLESVGIGWQAQEQYLEKLNAISPKQIQDVTKRYFQNTNLTEGRLIPKRLSQTLRNNHDAKSTS